MRTTPKDELKKWAFGEPIGDDGFRQADLGITCATILYRVLMHPSRHRTRDPAQADLFIIPLLPRGPPYSEYNFAEQAEFDRLDREDRRKGHTETVPSTSLFTQTKICTHMWTSNLSTAYAHLNWSTAPRHIFLALDHVQSLSECTLQQKYARKIPRSRDLLERMMWISHEDYLVPPAGVSRSARLLSYASQQLIPGSNLGALAINAPFVGTVHNRDLYEHAFDAPRPYLFCFGGSLYAAPRNVPLRRRVFDDCKRYGEPTCRTVTPLANESMAQPKHLVAAFRNKLQSVFCLEPAGYSYVRSATVDSLNLGCIPVLFFDFEEGVLPRAMPLHWRGWINESLVVLSYSEYVAGKLDLKSALLSISPARVAQMQAVLRSHMARFVYHDSLDYDGVDAIDVLLAGLVFGADAEDSIAPGLASFQRLAQNFSTFWPW